MTAPSTRNLMLAAASIVLITLAGCPSASTETSGVSKRPVSTAEKPPADEPIVAATLPAAEFQQPADVPPSEPLPKPAIEAMEPPAALPQLPANPLRGAAASPDTEVVSAKEVVSVKAEETPAASTGRPNIAKNSGVPFDPVKENGRIFEIEEDGRYVPWPKPKAALVITGMEHGYIEPCGCAGLDRMKGGMSRRHTLFKQLRADGWPVVGLDVGGLASGFGQQAELKFHTMVEGQLKMGYDAIAMGADDLRLPAAEFATLPAGVNPFVSANVDLFDFDSGITAKFRLIKAGGMTVGVTAVLGATYQKEIHSADVKMADPEAALTKIMPELKGKADYLVLLAHATMDESIALAKKFPQFDVVVTSDGQPEPPKEAETVPGMKTLLITVGYKGMNAIVLGLYDGQPPAVRYQRVPLDSRFAASPDMKTLMDAYQYQLKIIGLAGLGLRPVPHPLQETNGRFVGSAKCESCHEISYDIWKKSLHAHAYDTLAKLDPPRNFDPECLSCHVVGWNPQQFFPYINGFESKEKTPQLINTGCEDCHGPGEKHCAVELAGSDQLKQELRKAMVVTKEYSEKQQCMTCHDLDNSPDFDFKAYWPFVEHIEKE